MIILNNARVIKRIIGKIKQEENLTKDKKNVKEQVYDNYNNCSHDYKDYQS